MTINKMHMRVSNIELIKVQKYSFFSIYTRERQIYVTF